MDCLTLLLTLYPDDTGVGVAKGATQCPTPLFTMLVSKQATHWHPMLVKHLQCPVRATKEMTSAQSIQCYCSYFCSKASTEFLYRCICISMCYHGNYTQLNFLDFYLQDPRVHLDHGAVATWRSSSHWKGEVCLLSQDPPPTVSHTALSSSPLVPHHLLCPHLHSSLLLPAPLVSSFYVSPHSNLGGILCCGLCCIHQVAPPDKHCVFLCIHQRVLLHVSHSLQHCYMGPTCFHHHAAA